MINIQKPGLLTSIQDEGRIGYQQFGIGTSGAMDQLSFRLANWLVGNEGNEAVLEITMLGPTIAFEADALIAICGADLSPAVGKQKLQNGRTFFVRKGSVLRFGTCRSGCRAYLAIAGGFAVADVMESKSTYLLANIGGYQGRALQQGDSLQAGECTETAKKLLVSLRNKLGSTAHVWQAPWGVSDSFCKSFSQKIIPIRVTHGKHFDNFDAASRKNFFAKPFHISSQSDRMGYRLENNKLINLSNKQLLSEAVRFGTIQVPPDGNPIVLMADHQTTGGYPKIAEVATVDLPLLAQAKPGDQIQFQSISLAEAHKLMLEREKALQLLRLQINQQFEMA
ncbi:biotin-dependent carboxyltransferase family protein [Virgibacillus sp. 179-BFC.A HS]|uniref:Biotin-dependent carboxyltransferase family protein n=1 Tax=Tigheibacillus jepli TaxID=3035914 RepID=A0ABU5CGF1_9BACI|nr:biotin-dependent carboxyltransferase family protein [Virgibacillus sp. 179-BFC.A HS]MDY0404952.1 biotin-dependent carboxyltransferase family protein [Virgibacillus sp. 179-BFC.A HS]